MLTVSILVGTLCIAIILDHFQRLRRFKWLNQFDGPSPALPIVGNSLQFVGHPSMPYESASPIFNHKLDWWTISGVWSSERYGEIFLSNLRNFGMTYKFWQLTKPSLVTVEPQLVKIILSSTKHLQKHILYESTVKVLLGNGLISSDVDQWKPDRKFLNHFFNKEFFESSFKLCLNNWPVLENAIEAGGNKPLKCQKHLNKYFLKILLISFCPNPSLITENTLCEMEDQFTIGLSIMNLRIMKPWTKIPLYWKMSGYEKKLTTFHKKCIAIFSRMTDVTNLKGVSSEHDRSGSDETSTADRDLGTKSPKTFKELYTDTNKSWKWKYDHSMTLVGAGVDTVSVAATMTLFFLALNPKCQQKAQKEIDSHFSEHEALTYQAISKMKYLRMCVKEAMRLHPPAPIFGRTTTEDILMEDGRKIPKGSSIYIPLQGLHLNPEYFPEPHRFDPERFSESRSSSIKQYTYIPFSAGLRNCIGQKYAESILPPTLAQVLRKYSVTTSQKAEDIKILFEVAGTPFPEVQLSFERR